LALRLEMARDKALQRNREWGVYFDEEGVRFAEFDEVNGQWTAYTQRPFVAERYAETVELKVTVEEFTPLTDTDKDDELPSIVLYSSGETTPFTVDVTPRDWTTRPWQLSTDGFTRIKPTRDE
jgi:general secretion pathway protein H